MEGSPHPQACLAEDQAAALQFTRLLLVNLDFYDFSLFFNVFSWFFMKLYFKELDFKELGFLGYLLGVLGYSDLLGLGVPGYSDLLGLDVPGEWLLDLP